MARCNGCRKVLDNSECVTCINPACRRGYHFTCAEISPDDADMQSTWVCRYCLPKQNERSDKTKSDLCLSDIREELLNIIRYEVPDMIRDVVGSSMDSLHYQLSSWEDSMKLISEQYEDLKQTMDSQWSSIENLRADTQHIIEGIDLLEDEICELEHTISKQDGWYILREEEILVNTEIKEELVDDDGVPLADRYIESAHEVQVKRLNWKKRSPGGSSCQMMTRKRRRGVIEKKRRDRINTSLTELKRLVPAACEKQGSAKLEKAEILQLTVDHLKMLHSKGLDTYAYDPQRYAMDYHSIGFRECASEVARYLVSCEGLDIQDPLRLRLMSHLQCFAAQRELAAKSANWGYPQYPSVHQPQHGYGDVRHEPTTSASAITITAPSAVATPLSAPPSYSHYPPAPPAPTGPPAPPGPHPAPTVPHYPAPYPHHPTHHQYSQNSSKPYRPWGAELAY